MLCVPEVGCVEIPTSLAPLRNQCEGQGDPLGERGVGGEVCPRPGRAAAVLAPSPSVLTRSPHLGAPESQVPLFLQV